MHVSRPGRPPRRARRRPDRASPAVVRPARVRALSAAGLASGAALTVALVTGCSGGDGDTAGPASLGPTAAEGTPTATLTVPPADGGPTAPSGVGKDEAGRIATDRYGGTVKNVESDTWQGTPAWEVEVRDSSQGRIEVKVDKRTGEILHVEPD